MSAKDLKVLRVSIMTLLALLFLQFEFGMATNLSNLPSLPPIPNTMAGYSTGFNNTLAQAGPVAVVHASLGSLLGLATIFVLVLCLRSGRRSVQVFGSLAFVTTLLAGITGTLFVMSGFQNDGFSHGMATNFLLAYTFYFLELYFLKPAPRPSG